MPNPPDFRLSTLRWLRRIALFEGATLLLLVLVGVPLKHAAGVPQVSAARGPLHGAAFIAYFVCLFRAAVELDFTRRELARLALAALLPFGTWLDATWLRRRQQALAAG